MRWLLRHPVLLSAIAYLLVGTVVIVYTESTMPLNVTRLLITLDIAYGFPLLIALVWVFSGRHRLRRATLVTALIFVLGTILWLLNTSRFSVDGNRAYFLAHRGVHQVMNPEHESAFRCLGRIEPPEHDYIENTIPSIQAAFDLGARIVEVDIRPTLDGHFVVFHDDMLDCKTEALGSVRERSLAELQQLDVGFGYFTGDGERPLRGKGVGMMRSLHEVLDAFPGKKFFIDVKFGNNRELWERLVGYLAIRSAEDLRRITINGAPRGVEIMDEALPDIRTSSRERAFRCARSYILTGWSGYVPSICNRSIAGTYVDTGWIFWGWPRKFVSRMESADTIVLIQPRGQTEQEFARSIPSDYSGGIVTDRIESFRAWMNAEDIR